jgi:DNA-binding IscR family transcriptional regulator
MSRSIDPSEAIRCLQQLCSAGELTRLNVAEIARLEGLDADHVAAILEALAGAGFVEHAHGQYRLIRPPASISVADVWAAVNGAVSRPGLGRAPGSPATVTFADLLRWESQLFDNGPIARAA